VLNGINYDQKLIHDKNMYTIRLELEEQQKIRKENLRMLDLILMIMRISNDKDQFEELIVEKGIEQGLFG